MPDFTPAENRILREAYKLNGSDKTSNRVYFKDLRVSSKLSPATFDSTVKGLASKGYLNMYKIDDANDVKSKGLADSAINIAGNDRHVMYLSTSGLAQGAKLAGVFKGAASPRKSGGGGSKGG